MAKNRTSKYVKLRISAGIVVRDEKLNLVANWRAIESELFVPESFVFGNQSLMLRDAFLNSSPRK